MRFLLVHGAGSGPWIWEGWDGELIDLHAGLAVSRASMLNYEAAVVARGLLLPRPLVVVGWSMGGLAALMAARRLLPDRLVLLEPSPPAEVQGVDLSVTPREGTYDAEQEYGSFPQGVRARPESVLARDERKRGVSVPDLPCPTLVVHGDKFPDERGREIAQRYGAEAAYVEGSHWDLVRGKKARAAAVEWVR